MPRFPVCPAVGHMGEFGWMGMVYVYGILQWGGVWTLAGALPIFNRINYRRGCFYEKVFPACHCDPELVSG